MKKTFISMSMIIMILISLCVFSGCGAKEEGLFIPASEEEYMILDEGKTEDTSGAGKKAGSSNTNAKKSSGKDSKDDDSSKKQDSSQNTAVPVPTANSQPSVSLDPSKDETPFVPAEDTSDSKSSGKSKSGKNSSVIQDGDVTITIN